MSSTSIPDFTHKYFWGDDLSQLNWRDHQTYIISTLLERGNTSSIQWLFQQVPQAKIKAILPTLKLSPKSKNFWQLYLS